MYIHKRRTVKRYNTAVKVTGSIRSVRNGHIWRIDRAESVAEIYTPYGDIPDRQDNLRLYSMARDCIFDERYMELAKRLDRNQRRRYSAWHNAVSRRKPRKPTR